MLRYIIIIQVLTIEQTLLPPPAATTVSSAIYQLPANRQRNKTLIVRCCQEHIEVAVHSLQMRHFSVGLPAPCPAPKLLISVPNVTAGNYILQLSLHRGQI